MTEYDFSYLCTMQKIELLSPAKNLACGLAAIEHGADAVYIGAPRFGARAAAGNSIGDIETLAKYAHRFRAKVYVALNTLLTDELLTDAEKLIRQLYEAGTDALIIQDMGVLKMNLPPIVLHASTQADNRTADKIKFLADSGISRVVLARELSLNEIKSIRSQTTVELEAFVHGALCVGYSGLCYISQAMCGRSANRGECAQFCRLPYDLTDADGNILIRNKHLLSLKDLNLSDSLNEMIDAGIGSFKIEGRLKDMSYVKNITAFYRKKLDVILSADKSVRAASLGKTVFFFEPDAAKSFNRGTTDYFLRERRRPLIQADTPKSLGEKLGIITYVGHRFFELSTGVELHNGDGLCFVDKKGVPNGCRVNRVEAGRIYPFQMPVAERGMLVYRNFDSAFEKMMQGKTSERKIPVVITFAEGENGFLLTLKDEEGISIRYEIVTEKQVAEHPEKALEALRTQLSKLGNTVYEALSVEIDCSVPYFFPASKSAGWRREAVELFDRKRNENDCRAKSMSIDQLSLFPQTALTYSGNVTNRLAEQFYREHGVEKIDPGFEVKAPKDVPLMLTKYCIKYETGCCPKEQHPDRWFGEPLYLKNNGKSYRLTFDCRLCEMRIKAAE
ncbi:MAG: U32 family peptidase [Prevotellaceae bacterium]|nr:U32 family peptidase [Prevotellaceae bacterium]